MLYFDKSFYSKPVPIIWLTNDHHIEVAAKSMQKKINNYNSKLTSLVIFNCRHDHNFKFLF